MEESDVDIDDGEDEEHFEMRLLPYDVLSIASFLDEFKKEFSHPSLAAIRQSVENFKNEMWKHVEQRHIDEAKAMNQVNAMLGKGPAEDRNGEGIV